jgi:phosphoribosylamine-glycine ligase
MAAARAINECVAAALSEECGEAYKGILYGGFIATRDGVKLIEYNARFGDPECLNLLTLLEADFVEMCRAIVEQKLGYVSVGFAEKASVCKYVVPYGYPDDAQVGDEVVLPKDLPAGVTMYLGAVDMKDGELVATGSRTVGIVGVAETIAEAEQMCEGVVREIPGRFFHRADIGTAELIAKRVEHMKAVRS